MKMKLLSLAILTAALLGMFGFLEYNRQLSLPGSPIRLRAEEKARQSVAEWHEKSLHAAELMIENYGPPDQVSDYSIEWKRRGPWKRVVVRRRAVESPIEHVIDYAVPAFRFNEVAWFGNGLSLNETTGELSASGASEALNVLALNMGHELAIQQRTLEDAREFFTMTASLAARGKSSPYMERLMFTPGRNSMTGRWNDYWYWPPPESLMSW